MLPSWTSFLCMRRIFCVYDTGVFWAVEDSPHRPRHPLNRSFDRPLCEPVFSLVSDCMLLEGIVVGWDKEFQARIGRDFGVKCNGV